MATIARIEKGLNRYTALDTKGEAIAFVSQEDNNLIRVDYQLSYGWEDECFEGDFDSLDEEKVRKILCDLL